MRVCPVCGENCDPGIHKPHAAYPFVVPEDRVQETPDTDSPSSALPLGRRRGRRAKKKQEDRMRRPEADR